MRKHFLLLFLLTLLPLAGWAADVAYNDYADLSEGWSIKLEQTAATYNGHDLTPTVTLTRTNPDNETETQVISSENFKVTWRNSSNQVVTEIVNFDEGGYTVTVEKNNVKTWGALATPTKKFMVMKATVVEKTPGAKRTTGLQWTGNPITLLTAHYKAKISGTEIEVPVKYSIGKTGELTSNFPTATKVGIYKLFWNVEESDNYAATQVEIGDVAIVGNDIEPSDYTAPAAVEGTLTFTWENNAAKELNLLKANTGTIAASKGTFMYAVRTAEVANLAALNALPASAWTTTATATNAGNYVVYWKIKGGEGQNDVAPAIANKFEKTVAKADIVITSAVGYGNLSYKVSGNHEQNLIQTAGSATNGATSLLKYRVRYKTSASVAYSDNWSAYKAANAIKGTAAGIYQIETAKVDPASGAINYNAATPQYTEIAISKANALTSAPTAADLTWNGAAQQLITAGAGSTAEGNIIKYGFSANATTQPDSWNGDITTIKQTAASPYFVWFKVDENTNYATIAPTLIENVMIKRKDVSFKVNDITKTYNGLVDLTGATIDGTETAVAGAGAKRFTITGLIDASDFSGIAYSDLPEYCKNANEYADVMKVAEDDLKGVNPNYRYTIIPGKLTIKKVKLTVTAVSKKTTFGQPCDVSDSYEIDGLVTVETVKEPASAAFQTLPILTTNAAAVNPAPGEYKYTFTKGVLKTTCNYEMDTTYGENKDGYKIGDAKFTVEQDPEAKIVITVAAHTQSYTGVAESWDNMVEGKDYYVTGLIDGDHLTTAPTFTRSDATNFNVGTYDLEASGAAVANIKQYPGGIIYQKSTFKITPAKLTATINQQTVPVNPLADAFDLDAWDVEGLQGPDATTGKSVLNGQLAYNEGAAPAANLAAADVYTKGIKLTINNANYVLDGANVEVVNDVAVAYGTLIVTDAQVLALQSTDDNLMGKLQAAETHNTDYSVCFVGDDREMLAKEWYAVVLPFDTDPLELSTKLNSYVVVNLLKSSKIEFNSTANRDEAVVNFGIEMDKIPAGTPFLIKPAKKVKWNVIDFNNMITDKKIKSTVVPTVTEKATFSATYETGKSLKWGYELDGTTENADMKYRWLANTTDLQAGSTTEYRDNAWYNCKSNAHALELMEAFLILDPAAQGARIFVEDIDDNGTTAIKSLNADQVNGLKVAEGWYTLNGVKLQGMPTEKGIYINNGKKVVIK